MAEDVECERLMVEKRIRGLILKVNPDAVLTLFGGNRFADGGPDLDDVSKWKGQESVTKWIWGMRKKGERRVAEVFSLMGWLFMMEACH